MQVLEALQTTGYDSDKLEAVAQRIVLTDTVSFAELVAAGLTGRDIVAVRRLLGAVS